MPARRRLMSAGTIARGAPTLGIAATLAFAWALN